MKKKLTKFQIFTKQGVEEFDSHEPFTKRRKELEQQGVTLNFQINSSLGKDFIAEQSTFSDRMRHLHAMGVGFFPMVLLEPNHYVSLNLYNRLNKQKQAI